MKKLSFMILLVSFLALSNSYSQDLSIIKEKLAKMGFEIEKNQVTATDFILEGLNNGKFKLSENKDKVIFFNQWATWCPPCKAEMPSIQRLHEKINNSKFKIVAVSLGEKKEKVAAFIRQAGYTFPIFLDPSGTATANYSSGAIPTTYLIGKNGIILGKIVGGAEWDTPQFISIINELLK
jgi:thiol-disulfide isomerase/thioredoxin